MVGQNVARRIGEWIRQYQPEIVDLTGGAPELSGFFRFFVETARSAGSHVIDRCNLTAFSIEAACPIDTGKPVRRED